MLHVVIMASGMISTLCMLGNFSGFCCRLLFLFSKVTFSKTLSECQTAHQGLYCLQSILADDKSPQKFKEDITNSCIYVVSTHVRYPNQSMGKIKNKQPHIGGRMLATHPSVMSL